MIKCIKAGFYDNVFKLVSFFEKNVFAIFPIIILSNNVNEIYKNFFFFIYRSYPKSKNLLDLAELQLFP